MRNVLAVFKKEMGSYLHSPIAYVLTLIFLILTGYFFQSAMSMLSDYSSAYPAYMQQYEQMRGMGPPPPPPNVDVHVISRTYGTMIIILLFLVPMLTMRTYAEEQRMGTMELLMTSPITPMETLLGKFFGALGIFTAIVALTLIYPILITVYADAGSRPDWGALFATYLGLFLFGAACLSIGIFASSLTENQIIAAAMSFALLLMLFVIGVSGQRQANFSFGQFLLYLSITGHMDKFQRGVIAVKDLVYYISMASFMLFVTNRVLEAKRWRQ